MRFFAVSALAFMMLSAQHARADCLQEYRCASEGDFTLYINEQKCSDPSHPLYFGIEGFSSPDPAASGGFLVGIEKYTGGVGPFAWEPVRGCSGVATYTKNGFTKEYQDNCVNPGAGTYRLSAARTGGMNTVCAYYFFGCY